MNKKKKNKCVKNDILSFSFYYMRCFSRELLFTDKLTLVEVSFVSQRSAYRFVDWSI